jgi:predicted nucleic acid-binding protein
MEMTLQRRHCVVVVVLAVVCLVAADRVFAQDGSLFANRARVMHAMDNDPARVAVALEQVLSVEQASELEALLDVAPDDREAARSLREAKRHLLESGLDASDALVLGVDGKLAAIEARSPDVPEGP